MPPAPSAGKRTEAKSPLVLKLFDFAPNSLAREQAPGPDRSRQAPLVLDYTRLASLAIFFGPITQSEACSQATDSLKKKTACLPIR